VAACPSSDHGRCTREPGADEGETQGLIADVSIYLCDDHYHAHARIDDAEPFPPESDQSTPIEGDSLS
jgi:hypothetical protein